MISILWRLLWFVLFGTEQTRDTLKNPCNWLVVSAIGTIFLGGVAIAPILKEFRHRQKYKRVLRELTYIEIRDINESYKGKIKTFEKDWQKGCITEVIVPEHDFNFFKRLGISYKEATYLSRKERDKIGEIIRAFRKGSYHKRIVRKYFKRPHYYYQEEKNIIDKDSVYNIVDLTNYALNLLHKNI